MHRSAIAITLMLIPFFADAAADPNHKVQLLPTDQAEALVAAQRLFGSRQPTLELIDSGTLKGSPYATFASPISKISERLSTYTSILCRSDNKKWTCALGYPEARYFANGIEHRNFLAPDMQADALLEVADFIYSPCFLAQLAEFLKSPRLSAPGRIRSIHQTGARFSVQGDSDRTYQVERAKGSVDGCKFKVVGTGIVVF